MRTRRWSAQNATGTTNTSKLSKRTTKKSTETTQSEEWLNFLNFLSNWGNFSFFVKLDDFFVKLDDFFVKSDFFCRIRLIFLSFFCRKRNSLPIQTNFLNYSCHVRQIFILVVKLGKIFISCKVRWIFDFLAEAFKLRNIFVENRKFFISAYQ